MTPGQEVRQLTNDLTNSLKTQSQIEKISGKNNANYRAATQEVERLQRELRLSNLEVSKLRQNTKGFSFDFLTLLFAGMMLQRTFGGMFKSIIDSYKKAAGMNSQFNRSVLKLSANFEFLKFSIANALNSPFVINAIEWFTDRLAQLADILADNPEFANIIIGVVAALATIGTLSMIASGVKQIEMLLGIMGLTSTATAIENLSKLAKIGTIVVGITLTLGGIADMLMNGMDIENIIATSIGAAFLGFAWFSASRGIAGAALTGLGIGAIIASALVSIKLIFFDIDKTMEQDAGWARAGNLLLVSLGAMVAGAAVGAGIGSFIPVVGTAIGGLIGFIVAGIGVLFKLSNYRDEIDTSEIKAGVGGGGGARAVEDAFKGLEEEYKNQTIEISPEVKAYTEQIKQTESVDLFKGIDMEKFNSFKQTLSDIKEPLANFNLGLSGEKGFYVTLFSINELLGTTLLNYMDKMNTYLSNGVSLTYSYNAVLTTQITNMNSLATSTNKAAAAQERLNKAKEKAGGVIKSIVNAVTGKSKSTTTR